MAVQIFDQKTIKMTRDEYRIRQVTKGEANTLEELAEKLRSRGGFGSDGEGVSTRRAAGGLQSGDPGREGHQGHHAT